MTERERLQALRDKCSDAVKQIALVKVAFRVTYGRESDYLNQAEYNAQFVLTAVDRDLKLKERASYEESTKEHESSGAP